MKWLNQVTSLFLMAFSILILTSSLHLGVGSLQAPGPGFVGFLASILLFVLSLVIFVKEIISVGEEKTSLGWQNLSKSFIITVALSGYALFLETLGFLLSSFILMTITLLISSPRRWYYHMLVAFMIVNVSYLVFCKWLRVVLPLGIFHIRW